MLSFLSKAALRSFDLLSAVGILRDRLELQVSVPDCPIVVAVILSGYS